MSERAFVTGGAGVIGRSLLHELCAQDDIVRCVDVRPPPAWLPEDVDYIQADIRGLDDSALIKFAPTRLYHLAATFERSVEQPTFWRENAEHNVRLSQQLLAAAERCRSLSRIVFASSYLIYDPVLYLQTEPPQDVVALREGSRIRPRNACGAAKLLHEYELELASKSEHARFSAVFARIYRVYGRGSFDVIGRWVRAAARGEVLTVYGAESLFDYVFADDVARALALLGPAEMTGPVNVATGRPRRVSEVIEILRGLAPSLEVIEGERPELWEASAADVSALRDAISWVPDTALEDGIPRLMEHEQAAVSPGSRAFVGFSAHDAGPEVGVLVTSVSRKVPLLLAFREAFLATGIEGSLWGADADPGAPGAHEADRFWFMPPLDELTDESFLDFCRRQRIRLVVPTRDGELHRLAALREWFEQEGIRVAVSPPEAVESCIDKLSYAEACLGAACVPVPTVLDAADLDVDSLVVKPRRGAGSHLISIGVTRPDANRHADRLDEAVFQPFTTGVEHSVDVFVARDGTRAAGIPRRRDLIVAGESQVSTVVQADDLVEECLRIANGLGLRGHAVFQAIATPQGWQHLECNPRVGGASSLAFAAGLHTPEYLLLETIGEELPYPRGARVGLRMVRRPTDRFLFP